MADPHPSDQPLETGPTWSHDGRWVAYTSWDGMQGGHVWKVPARGGTPVRLTTMSGRYAHLAWHPDDSALSLKDYKQCTRVQRQMLAQTWPIERDYGPRPWTNDDITRTDVRADDYWDRRPPG